MKKFAITIALCFALGTLAACTSENVEPTVENSPTAESSAQPSTSPSTEVVGDQATLGVNSDDFTKNFNELGAKHDFTYTIEEPTPQSGETYDAFTQVWKNGDLKLTVTAQKETGDIINTFAQMYINDKDENSEFDILSLMYTLINAANPTWTFSDVDMVLEDLEFFDKTVDLYSFEGTASRDNRKYSLKGSEENGLVLIIEGIK